MGQRTVQVSDKVTVLVFKDNYAARTFQIPLSWISKFGFFIGILILSGFISLVITFKYYRLKWFDVETPAAVAPQTVVQTPSAPPAAATPTQPIQTESQAQPPKLTSSLLFSGFPTGFSANLPDPTTLSFRIQDTKVHWSGRNLKVRFALQYTRQDQGNQQGRLWVIGRGPEQIVTYPAGLLNRIGAESLINPDKGESFSVSRYREVKADFGPFKNQKAIQEVEIFITDKNGQLLAYQKLDAGPPTAVAAPQKEVVKEAPPIQQLEPAESTTQPSTQSIDTQLNLSTPGNPLTEEAPRESSQ